MSDVFGSYIGKNAKGILVLGESHHWDKTDAALSDAKRKEKEETYRTAKVVESYLSLYACGDTNPCYAFFEKIVRSFQKDVADRENFWNQVHFKNLVDDVLCGVQTRAAKEAIKQNRDAYNNDLFRYLNEHHITTIFVFSRAAYNALPSLFSTEKEKEGKLNASDRCYYISHCRYFKENPHDHTDVILENDVEVYGLRHPSARSGYDPEKYAGLLKNIRDKLR